jgi:hypothetical protein
MSKTVSFSPEAEVKLFYKELPANYNITNINNDVDFPNNKYDKLKILYKIILLFVSLSILVIILKLIYN